MMRHGEETFNEAGLLSCPCSLRAVPVLGWEIDSFRRRAPWGVAWSRKLEYHCLGSVLPHPNVTGAMNHLFYGDNLDVLRRYIPAESVDLVYLDPALNRSQNYTVLFQEQDGARSAAQILAFEDPWRWDQGSAPAVKDALGIPIRRRSVRASSGTLTRCRVSWWATSGPTLTPSTPAQPSG